MSKSRVTGMYCNQCGGTLPEGSRFCNHCGAPFGGGEIRGGHSPEESVAVRGRTDLGAEEVIFVLRPTLLFVIVWYVIAGILVAGAAALMGVLSSSYPDVFTGTVSFITILAVAAIAFAIPLFKHVMRQRELYTLTNHKFEMRFGLIAKTIRNIPLRNIQDVIVTARAWERIFGIGDIVIDSASESGKITLTNIHRPELYANRILNELGRG